MKNLLRNALATLVTLTLCVPALAAPNDWVEGDAKQSDGASRDYYNRAARLAWNNHMGDWRDAADQPQGDRAYSTTKIEDTDTPRLIEFDVTSLVREWVAGTHQNQGAFLRAVKGGTIHFASREHDAKDQRPQLVITIDGKQRELAPVADTHLDRSTYRSLGDQPVLKISGNSNNALLRFDLSDIDKSATITTATLRLFTTAQYGDAEVAVFRCAQGHDAPDVEPKLGLAAKYPNDNGIADDPAVLFFDDFDGQTLADRWTFVAGQFDTVARDDERKFQPLQGKAVRVKMAEGTNTAMNVGYKFRNESGGEPEEIYFRYYLRLAADWNQTSQGGKMPGVSGTYGRAGWGGRKSDGRNGWSARGAFGQTIPAGNPLAGRHPIGTYCYHADMTGQYGNVWLWQTGYRGYLQSNRWYAIEQHVKLNTPGKPDGVLRAWIDGRPAFEKTDIRYRHVDSLKIEQIWMNVYHGGKLPSPRDQHLFIDNVVIAKQYIGPMKAK